MLTRPSWSFVVLVLGTLILIAGFTLGVIALANGDSRTDIISHILEWVPGVAAAIAAFVAARYSGQSRKASEATQDLVNGTLSARVDAGVSSALAAHGLARDPNSPEVPVIEP